ncbi:type VI secretion protein IcmF/TssM N-terminal domain-containing protein [Fuerstiella marisgermanici]|uniref:Type VI secretion protein IcmF n=1 Tax=Fuerstiella marisgermanici TaxID=1891926 RepID=A0A1P8WI74_9PLAN|nr:type VI secretion protein IcmF/TssM N-terminal domain-containing protein [Fuerstiella marisgermanici]APZ93760.1 type VI secretion protein IcmF [Fuerstiella marisgermanici]
MRSIFYKVLEWTRLLFGMMPRSGVGNVKVYLIIHYCFIALVAITLAIFSNVIRDAVPGLRGGLKMWDWLERTWCGVAFLIVYAIIRIVLYLMELLGIEDDSEFPDIEADWEEILDALDRERLPIDDVPLFLVNGFTPQQEQSAFDAASEIEWRVVAPPVTQKSAVLRVFANDDAIFLCCTGVGSTNLQQGKVSNEPSSRSSAPVAHSGVTGTQAAGQLKGVVDRAKSVTGTNPAMGAPPPPPPPAGAAPAGGAPMAPPPPPAPVAGTGTQSKGIGAFFGTIAPGGLKRAMETFSGLNRSDAKGYGKKRLAPLSELESMIGIRRIEFVCHLINRSRAPYCPINGMLQAVPFSWAEEVDYARKLAPAIRDDVVAVHERLQLQFPVVVVVTELDDVPGMREFILRANRLQPGLRLSRAGSSFAAGADVSDKNAEWVIERGMQWFRGWVYSAFSYDLDNKENQKLFNMLCEVNQRKNALVTLLRESLYKVVTPRARLQGCYFCATGQASTEQAFIRGVLDKLPESQGDVAWTPQLKRSQKRSSTIAWACFGAAALLMVLTVLLARGLTGGGAS